MGRSKSIVTKPAPQEAIQTRPKGTPGPPLGSANHKKSGYWAAKKALSEWGNQAIDGRSSTARALAAWRTDVATALGGEDQLSPQQRTVLDLLTRTKFLLDGLDGYILSSGMIINKRKHCLHPIVLQRQQLVDSIIKHLCTLGLERKAAPVPSLQDYLASDDFERDRVKPNGQDDAE